MGGLARRIPLTFVTFAIATAAIAGIPPLAGFFSKDAILWYAFASTRGGSPLLWLVAAATALMTAFYMFRLLWLTFLGRSRMTAEVEHHVHESPLSMTGVLALLALLSVLGGFIAIPEFLAPQLPLPASSRSTCTNTKPRSSSSRWSWRWPASPPRPSCSAARPSASNGCACASPACTGGSRPSTSSTSSTSASSASRWYGFRTVSFFASPTGGLLDGTLNGMASLGRGGAAILGRLQTGSLHLYAWFVLVGIVGALSLELASCLTPAS